MGDDVVKLPEPGRDVQDVHALEGHVSQAQLCDGGLPAIDLAARGVQAHKLALGQGVGHGNDVAATGAPHLQHAAAMHRSRVQAQERRQRQQAIRVALRVAEAGIGYLVVAGICFFAHYVEPSTSVSAAFLRAIMCPMAKAHPILLSGVSAVIPGV